MVDDLWVCSCLVERDACALLSTRSVFNRMTLPDLLRFLFPDGRCAHYHAAQRVILFDRPCKEANRRAVFAIPQPALTVPKSPKALKRQQELQKYNRLQHQPQFFSVATAKEDATGSGCGIPRLQRAIVRMQAITKTNALWCYACKTNRCHHTEAARALRQQSLAADAAAETQRRENAPEPECKFDLLPQDHDRADRTASSSNLLPVILSKATIARRADLGTSIRFANECRTLSAAQAAINLVPFPFDYPADTPTLCRWELPASAAAPSVPAASSAFSSSAVPAAVAPVVGSNSSHGCADLCLQPVRCTCGGDTIVDTTGVQRKVRLTSSRLYCDRLDCSSLQFTCPACRLQSTTPAAASCALLFSASAQCARRS